MSSFEQILFNTEENRCPSTLPTADEINIQFGNFAYIPSFVSCLNTNKWTGLLDYEFTLSM